MAHDQIYPKYFAVLSNIIVFTSQVSKEQPFKDKCFLYRFWQDEEGATALPSLEDVASAEDQVRESLGTLINRGPDAMMRLILRKP